MPSWGSDSPIRFVVLGIFLERKTCSATSSVLGQRSITGCATFTGISPTAAGVITTRQEAEASQFWWHKCTGDCQDLIFHCAPKCPQWKLAITAQTPELGQARWQATTAPSSQCISAELISEP